MSTQLYSPSWHRVDKLVPALRKHTQISRHYYRGVLWYVLQDNLSARVHRFTPAAYYMIGLMDGKRTVQQIWDLAVDKLEDDAPTQDEMIRLLGQLHAADVLQCDVPPDSTELFTRYKKQKKSKMMGRFLNPLSVRIPLFDPERFLSRTGVVVNALPGWLLFVLWSVVVVYGVVLAGMNWDALSENVADRVLTPQNLVIVWLIFPFIKALHELGHAFAVKRWGGEVHEIGIMFLVLMPIPYVDASAASSFRDKKKRVIVGAAGMMVEVFLAAVAMLVWLAVDTGLVHVIAYNTMLIAGISTILFNANPLLRFDGYYILADLIEIPNLGTRANKYLGYLTQRYMFAVKDLDIPMDSRGEKAWFVFYGIGSFLYRMFVVTIIVLFISAKFFIIGVILAIWSLVMMLVVPAVKSFSTLYTNPRIRPKRKRALLTLGGLASGVAAMMLWLPVQSWTRTEGVVWVEGDAVIRAGADCFITGIQQTPGAMVQAGDVLFECENRELTSKVKVLSASLEELKAVYTKERKDDLVKAKMAAEQIKTVQADLESARQEVANLQIKSKTGGQFVVPNASDLLDKFVRKGESIGYTLDSSDVTLKVAVDQDDIDLVRTRTHQVEMRLATNIAEVEVAGIKRYVPGATNQLPSAALTTQGGGDIAVDPSAPQEEGVRSFEKVFLLDLVARDKQYFDWIGSRVYVKFYHDKQPLGRQIMRSLRQVFLGHFDV